MKKNFYAVIFSNNESNIYTNWNDCERDICGMKNVTHKGFKTEEEARDFILAIKSQTKGEINVNTLLNSLITLFGENHIDTIKTVVGKKRSMDHFETMKAQLTEMLAPKTMERPKQKTVAVAGREYQVKLTNDKGGPITGYITHAKGQFYFAWDMDKHELPWIKGHSDTKWREHAKKILVEGGIA